MFRFHRVLITAAFLALSTHAFASGQLFSGIVERQTVQAAGTPDCARPCPVLSTPLADGGARVCISNDGGCQVAEIKVLHDFLGSDAGATRRIASRTGEFGELNFPSTKDAILVQVIGVASHWAPLYTHDGVESVDAGAVKHFEGLDAAALHPDADGRIAVSQLVRQLAH
jgi:hypothetical protein